MVKVEHTEPVFLGRCAPLLAAARTLLDGALTEGDLAHMCVVVPGNRAARQLLLALAEEAEERGVPLRPPRVSTPGQLEYVLRPPSGGAIASDIELHLALARALEGTISSQRERMALAQRYIRTNRELAAACVSWEYVAEVAVGVGGDPERYLEINSVFKKATKTLEGLGLQDADTARESSLQEPAVEGLEVVLLGVVELPKRIRRALREVTVRSLVVSGENDAEGFDELGLIRTDWWHAHAPEVPSARIHIEDKPIDQAEWVRERLFELATDGEIDPDRVALVLADESIADPLERELTDAGCPVHRAQGRRVTSLAPAHVLTHVAEHLEVPTVGTLRSLLQHPALEDAVISRIGKASEMRPVCALDIWLQHRYSRQIAPGWMGDPDEKKIRPELAEARRVLSDVDRVVSEMLEPFQAAERIPSEWMEHVVGLLAECFQERPADSSACIEEALTSIGSAAASILAAPQDLQWRLSAPDGIRMLLASLGEDPIQPRNTEPVALDMLGWLEVPFDSAPHVIVAGFNDGSVPNVSGVDPLLPDSLRAALGLTNEYSRTARDAWVLSCALERDVDIVVSRRDIRGESRVPSRLLLTGKGEALAQRVLEVTSNAKPRLHPGSENSSFGRPRPSVLDEGTVIELPYISVTGFRQYLRCPYGYWLRYILGATPPETTGREFDARAFGSILHAAVERYALSPEANTLVDSEDIEKILFHSLEEEISRLAGTTLAVGLRLQSHVLRQRLSRIADVLAEQRRAGWEIRLVEHEFSTELPIPGEAPIEVHGKADLVEFHPEEGWRILDFKTSDRGSDPDKAHHKPVLDEWIDLQLPLYRELLGAELRKTHEAKVLTGYFLAPADLTQVGIKMSRRVHELHDKAIAKAQEVVKNIRRGAFEPGSKPPAADHEEALIYRVHSIGDAGESEGGL